ncbi:MAG: citrate/2-methylcitrate synthase, partial [Ilumatobacteraceae bacterium]
KPATLYAYVSRGVLQRRRAADGRRSVFDAAEVDALARRGRPRRASRPFVFEVEIETSITEIRDHHLRFRGHDAVELARTCSVEQVAELLWTGRLLPLDVAHAATWPAAPIDLPRVGEGLDRIRLAVAGAAAVDPLRADLRPESVVACARVIVSTEVDSLDGQGAERTPRLALGDGSPLRATLAGRMWSKLAPGRARPEHVRVMNAALVLLVDHELAASTLAARVAASTRADPYAVVSAGLGPVSGPLHGGASRAARRMFDAAARAGGADAAVAEALREHGRCPGFGHPLYPGGDPRAVALLSLLREACGGDRGMSAVESVLSAVQRRVPVAPNIDAALAAFGHVTGMPVDAGETIFAVARTIGWIAHAMEEYLEAPVRFRPRARYVGRSGSTTGTERA